MNRTNVALMGLLCCITNVWHCMTDLLQIFLFTVYKCNVGCNLGSSINCMSI